MTRSSRPIETRLCRNSALFDRSRCKVDQSGDRYLPCVHSLEESPIYGAPQRTLFACIGWRQRLSVYLGTSSVIPDTARPYL